MYIYTGCLKIDANNDLLSRQVQRWFFRTHLVKNASFQLETSNKCCFFLLLSYQLPGHAIFF